MAIILSRCPYRYGVLPSKMGERLFCYESAHARLDGYTDVQTQWMYGDRGQHLIWNDTIWLVDGMFDLGILPYDYQSKKKEKLHDYWIGFGLQTNASDIISYYAYPGDDHLLKLKCIKNETEK